MKINVTAEHIKRGKPKSCVYCPVALALKEQFAPVVFNGWYVWCPPLVKGALIEMPQEVLDFAADFDAGKPVEPFSFELAI